MCKAIAILKFHPIVPGSDGCLDVKRSWLSNLQSRWGSVGAGERERCFVELVYSTVDLEYLSRGVQRKFRVK